MTIRRFGKEDLLEAGMTLFGAMLVVGLWFLLLGKVVGKVRRSIRHREGPPPRGSISSERHKNISTVATR